MKRIALLAIVVGGLLALPSSAAAQTSDCPNDIAGIAHVSSPPYPPVYACADSNGAAPGGVGGEGLYDPAGCSYVNGWSDNPDGKGYAGICTQTRTTDPGCDGIDGGSGSNTGGCFWIKPAPDDVNQALNSGAVGTVTAQFICGNTSGEDPNNTTRDGCSIP